MRTICPLRSEECPAAMGGGSEVLVVSTITTNTYQVITNGDEPIAPILSSDAHRGGGTYQNTVGTISPGAHPGSCNGQDAWSDQRTMWTYWNGTDICNTLTSRNAGGWATYA